MTAASVRHSSSYWWKEGIIIVPNSWRTGARVFPYYSPQQRPLGDLPCPYHAVDYFRSYSSPPRIPPKYVLRPIGCTSRCGSTCASCTPSASSSRRLGTRRIRLLPCTSHPYPSCLVFRRKMATTISYHYSPFPCRYPDRPRRTVSCDAARVRPCTSSNRTPYPPVHTEQVMNDDVHGHALVSGGGLWLGGGRSIQPEGNAWLSPEKLGRVFRDLFLKQYREAAGQLGPPGSGNRFQLDGDDLASSLPSNTASSSFSLAISLRIPALVKPFSPMGWSRCSSASRCSRSRNSACAFSYSVGDVIKVPPPQCPFACHLLPEFD